MVEQTFIALEDVERILKETSRWFAGAHVNAGVVVGEVRKRIRSEVVVGSEPHALRGSDGR